MADPLFDLLKPHLPPTITSPASPSSDVSRYLSRLVSLRLNDLTTTEPQSLSQAAQSNLVSLQALSSRSHRTTTTSSDHLSTLGSSLPLVSSSVEAIRNAIPDLDSSAVDFASAYNRSKDETTIGNVLLNTRRESALLSRQADKAQDILELPSLLSAAIASANTTSTSGASYTQALDLFAHIKRLQILYPDSQLVQSVLADAEVAMKDMTKNLIASLRGQNIRLAAAIRMIGWLRRVAPGLGSTMSNHIPPAGSKPASQFGLSSTTAPPSQDEGHFGALFLCARLCTFLVMTEALSPLRDLADQETQARKANSLGTISDSTPSRSRHDLTRKPSAGGSTYDPLAGQQTERYLKRYIEIFREQSFATISMYQNIFSPDEEEAKSTPASSTSPLSLSLSLPPALQSFPLHLIELFMATLKQYLPNVTDPAARESLLMQVLYAANSLGRLGADFSLMIATLDEDDDAEAEAEAEAEVEGDDHAEDVEQTRSIKANDTANAVSGEDEGAEQQAQAIPEPEPEAETEAKATAPATATEPTSDQEPQPSAPHPTPKPEPEWISVIKKHRFQSARLQALAAGQERAAPRKGDQPTETIAVR